MTRLWTGSLLLDLPLGLSLRGSFPRPTAGSVSALRCTGKGPDRGEFWKSLLHMKMGGILPSNIKNKNPRFCRNKMCNSLNKISSPGWGNSNIYPSTLVRESAALSAGAERITVLIHLLLLHRSSIFQKYICIYIYIFQIYREYFFVNKKQNVNRSYKGLSSQETSMISMLPEKLD